MKNWLIFLQWVPWCSLFVTLLQKIVVEYASSDIGVALEIMLYRVLFSNNPPPPMGWSASGHVPCPCCGDTI